MKSREKPHLAYRETNEQRRLNETREKGVPWKRSGSQCSPSDRWSPRPSGWNSVDGFLLTEDAGDRAYPDRI